MFQTFRIFLKSSFDKIEPVSKFSRMLSQSVCLKGRETVDEGFGEHCKLCRRDLILEPRSPNSYLYHRLENLKTGAFFNMAINLSMLYFF